MRMAMRDAHLVRLSVHQYQSHIFCELFDAKASDMYFSIVSVCIEYDRLANDRGINSI